MTYLVTVISGSQTGIGTAPNSSEKYVIISIPIFSFHLNELM